MRITRRPPIAEVPGLEEATGVAVSSSTAVPSAGRFVAATEGRDRVELSEAARLRQRLRTDVGDLGAIAAEQVTELRGHLAADSYQPAPHAVAERLLADLTADLIV